MPRHPGLPRPAAYGLSKVSLLNGLLEVDQDRAATQRILRMETEFREKIRLHLESLPTADAKFGKFNTSPFVLMFYSLQHGFSHIHEIEEAILPAKVFSSMETSAGRMVEAVVLPVYDWEVVPSEMHSADSALDGKRLAGDVLCLATLKSGPRCLNDEMSENIADAIITNCEAWAQAAGVKKIDFTYGVLYGTRKQSNKKDWHILRNIARKLPRRSLIASPDDQWRCEFRKGGIEVEVTVRIGVELWNYLAGFETAFLELCAALIRACIAPSDTEPETRQFTILDLKDIISLDGVPPSFNVAILQRSQLEWLFFLARHFCDQIVFGDADSLRLE